MSLRVNRATQFLGNNVAATKFTSGRISCDTGSSLASHAPNTSNLGSGRELVPEEVYRGGVPVGHDLNIKLLTQHLALFSKRSFFFFCALVRRLI